MLARVLERTCETQNVGPARAVHRDDVDEAHAALGDRSGLVEQNRGHAARLLEHLRPLMSTPSCAPRPVPTMSAVGVARPSAHGQE